MIRVGTRRPTTPTDGEPFSSAEEYPWASTEQGGINAYVFPVQESGQQSKWCIRRGIKRSRDVLIICSRQAKVDNSVLYTETMVLNPAIGSTSRDFKVQTGKSSGAE